MNDSHPRTDWTRAEVAALFALSFPELMWRAQTVHRVHHSPTRVQRSRLLSVKTGGCAEDCGYCSQSAKFSTGVRAEKLMDPAAVIADAARAKADGATRFCMGAAWSAPKPREMPALVAMVEGVRALGLETCMTLGRLDAGQSAALGAAGLDYYNHNLDTSAEYYPEVVGTRTYADRLGTLANVRAAGIAVCCGGIIGMGESRDDRVGLIHMLATLPEHPGSVPINALVPIPGTPLGDAVLSGARAAIDAIEFARTIAAARITMPRAMVRLSAGREAMSDEGQALAFLAGANSVFDGDRLLTTANPGVDRDTALFDRLGMTSDLDPAPRRERRALIGACL